MKMPTMVSIFIFIGRETFMLKKEFAIISNLRVISRSNFVLSWVEHEKSFTISLVNRKYRIAINSSYNEKKIYRFTLKNLYARN